MIHWELKRPSQSQAPLLELFATAFQVESDASLCRTFGRNFALIVPGRLRNEIAQFVKLNGCNASSRERTPSLLSQWLEPMRQNELPRARPTEKRRTVVTRGLWLSWPDE